MPKKVQKRKNLKNFQKNATFFAKVGSIYRGDKTGRKIEMINALVISNSLDFVKELFDSIERQKLSIRIKLIARNEDEGMENLLNDNIDVLFIEDKIYEKCKSLIIRNSESKIVLSINDFNSLNNSKVLKEAMLNNRNKKTSEKSFFVKRELEKMGCDFRYKGTYYLLDVILQVWMNKDDVQNFQKDIYPLIGKKYNKTVQSIKNSINNMIDHIYEDDNLEKMQIYFNINEDIKINIKQIVYKVLSKTAL